MKVASVVGARPQFVKAAAVSPELRRRVDEILIHTGQHYDSEMSQVFFDSLDIPQPNYNLGIGSASHGKQTGLMLTAIEEVLLREAPDFVLVYGDTNSTLAGALAAAKLQIPIGHVEAGLRAYDLTIPEEINRVVSDHLSSLLFAPTKYSMQNLRKEGIERGVHLVGDVMYDLAMRVLSVGKIAGLINDLGLKPKGFILATVHRNFNTDDERNLRSILEAFEECGKQVVLPLHPRTATAIKRFRIQTGQRNGRLRLIKPLGYLDFLGLLINAEKVVTDSGGVQKEAYFFGIPCITLRNQTEWLETVETGWNALVGVEKAKIVNAIETFKPTGKPEASFGDGHAAEKIAEIIASMSK